DSLSDGPGLGVGVEAAVGGGDSGGPAFLGGAIAGLTSTGTGNDSFGTIDTFTRTSYFASWIDNSKKGHYDLVLDMKKKGLGVDGAVQNITILAQRNGPNLELRVNAPNPTFTGLYYSAPAADIDSLTIRGGNDNETMRIIGPLGINTINMSAGTGNDKL